MKTKQLFLFLMLALTGISWGQTAQSLPYTMSNSFVRSGMTSVNGWTQTSIGTDYSSSGSNIKFDDSGDFATLFIASTPNLLSYNLKSNGLSGSYVFDLLESSNGTDFTVTQNITSGIGTTNTVFQKTLLSTTRYIRWRYTTKATGNIGFGGVNITAVTNLAPTASSVAIAGTQASGSVLTGSYTYADNENNPQGVSTFKWYRADDASGTGSLPISGATSTTYTLTPSDIGKYIRFGVVPVAIAGTTTGVETFSSWSGAIGAGSTPVLNIAATNALTEANLTTETITLTLTNDTFADATLDASNFILNNAPAGVTVAAVVYDSATEAFLSLAYTNTDFDTNITNFNITINGAELTSASNLTAANNLTITALTETLTATGTLAFGTLCSNVTPSKASFVISGSNAKDGTIDLAALSGYTYSETENGTYTSTLSVAQAAGTVNKTIWVTFSPTLAQTYNGNIVISGVGAPNVNKAVTGTGKIPVTGVVTTTAASAVASTSATLNGNLTTLGVCPATTEKGFVYCLTADSVNPVIEDAFADVESTTSSISTGNYSLNATLLTQGTSYTYRAFIYNGTDYIYGTAQSFTTTTPPVNDLCADALNITIDGNPVSGTLVSSTFSTPFSDYNDVWYKFTPSCTGSHIITLTGFSGDADLFVYSNSNNCPSNTTDLYSSESASTTETITNSFSKDITYYIRVTAYNLTAGNSTFTIAVTPPTPATAVVSTAAASSITSSSATLNGSVTTLGVCPTTTERGFVYALNSVNNNPEIGGTGVTQVVEPAALAANNFSENRTGLTSETTYAYKAYIKNDDITYLYGAVQTFTTPATTPTTAASAITFGTSTINTITVNSVTNGNGANRIMVVRPASASRVAPTNGITYTPNSLSFTDGANPTTGTNNIVVFNGTTISNQTITDLAINTNYTIDVYEYNGTGATTVYYYAASASASKTTLDLSAPVAIAADPVSTNSFTAKWDAVVGATGYLLDVSAYESFAITGASGTLNEGFEGVTFPPTGWINDGWSRSTSSGDYKNGIAGAVGNPENCSLTVKSVPNPTSLSFYLGRSSNTSAKTLTVEVSTTSQSSGFSVIATYDNNNVPVSSYNQYTIDLSAYNSYSNVYIKFVKSSSTTSPWRLDDISIQYATVTPSFISGYNSKEISGGATLSENITGLADETTYYYRVRAVNGSVVSANSNTITVTTETATTTWVSTNGGEWTNGAPTTVTDAIIDFPYNTTTAPIVAENLTVTTNGTLTVSATNPVTIHGNLINTNATAGAINVLNGGTLLQPNNTTTNGNTGNITYNRNTANLQNNDFVYWSSPVSGAKATSMGSIDKIYDFNHSSQAWNHINLNPTANPLSSITLANGVGYAVRFIGASNNPNTAAFEGVPNNGDVTITGITSSGAEKYMLLGNPYPSALDLEGLQNDNAAVLGQTFYFWTHANAYNGTNYNDADYATYNVELGAGTAGTNNGTAGTRYVSAGQGFFADLNSAGMSSATLTFKNSHRVGDNNTNFFRSAATQTTTQNTSAAKIWFNFKNENAFKQTLLAYTPNATNGYDPVDATTFDGQPYVDFYTLADNKKMVIQARAPFVNTDIVPMGYRVSHAGTYTIEIDHLDNVWNSQNIYLNDKQLNVVHDIKANPYSFTTPAGVFDTRFEIIYQTNALSNPDVSFDKAVIVFAKDKNIHINSSLETIKEVVVYDLQGRIITTKTNINATQAILTNVRAEEQVLLVKVTSTEGKITTKKVVF